MRSTVSTIVAAFAAIAVLVFGAHAWGQPNAGQSVTAAPSASSPQTRPSLASSTPTTPPVAQLSPSDSTPSPEGSPATGQGAGDGDATGQSSTAQSAPGQIPSVATDDGYLMATGQGPVFGSPANGLLLYTVEVEPSMSAELPTLLAATDAALGDPNRGWSARGGRSLQRTDDPQSASIRIILAPPAVVDRQCATAGLDTVGYYSCWNGWQTMLNSDRWYGATPDFTDLGVYRTYLINHEFGHGLGFNHEFCQQSGAPAPVMMQQSMGLGACTANGWPYP